MKLITRRSLLRSGLGAGLLVACGGGNARPTPAIDDGDAPPPLTCDGRPTADNIEGPYFKEGAPFETTLVRDPDDGERLALGGLVLSTACAPLADVLIDVWHADARGGYDTRGYHFRGKLRTDADGRWRVDTIIPGRYLNGRRYRPAHIHMMLAAAGHRPLTTQLYFDGDPYNHGDPFIDESLIMKVARGAARFDFVLEPTA